MPKKGRFRQQKSIIQSLKSVEDQVLVSRCLQGDEIACKKLYDSFASPMLNLCYRYSANSSDAEDNLQDGFIKIFQNLSSWKSTGPLGAWVRRIMINTCLTKQKSAYKLHTVTGTDELPEISIEPTIISSLSYGEIQEIISTMPHGYKTAFNLSIIEGYSYEEMSDILNVTESTCRSQVFKAKNFLARKLESVHSKIKYTL